MQTSTTYSSCYMCAFDCQITVDTIGTDVVAIDHPDCVRATALQEQRESVARLLHPQLRGNADDAWRTVSWPDAISDTARRLLEIRERHGPQAVAFAVGYTRRLGPTFSAWRMPSARPTTSPRTAAAIRPVSWPP